MRYKAKRLIAMMSVLLCLFPMNASGETARLASFLFPCSGSTAESNASYQVYETERGYLARIELSDRYIILLPMAAEELAALSRLVDAYLAQWDGFNGRDDSGIIVCDGESFFLSASYTGGVILSAQGANLFPDGYAEGREAIVRFFDALMQDWDIAL